MSLDGHKRDWEDLGRMDPLWAVLSVEERRYGRWNPDDFFRTGEVEIAAAMARAQTLRPRFGRQRALDFGCGVGRLTRALASRFDEVVGVDISSSMLENARQLNQNQPRCQFVQINTGDLRDLPDAHFDYVYSYRVLQHQPTPEATERYLREFVRVTRPGGLIMIQIPARLPLRFRMNWRRWVYEILRPLGFDHTLLYERLHLSPIKMTVLSPDRVRAAVTSAAELIEMVEGDEAGPRVTSYNYAIGR